MPPPPLQGMGLKSMVSAMKELVEHSAWSPLRNIGGPRNPRVNIWPNMTGPMGCVRMFTAPCSIITGRIVKDAYKRSRVRTHMDDYKPALVACPRLQDTIIYDRDIHIWTDGSAKNNGADMCSAGSAWVSDLQFSDKVSLTGAVLSNNVAEVAAVVLCLLAWRDAHVVIHTDSMFMLGLLKGGLLAMEQDGWGDAPRHMSRGPPMPLLQYLLYLLWDRTGRIDFVKAKAHSDDVMNNLADTLANEGRVTGRVFDVGSLWLPAGWVDASPVLCHQPLDYVTKLVMRARIQAPTSSLKFSSFLDRWVVTLGNIVLDPGGHISRVWSLAIPEGLKEVLWKEMNGTQVLGHRYYGTRLDKSDMGQFCLCDCKMSLQHILLGCRSYKLQPLLEVLLDALHDVSPASSFKTLHLDAWGHSPWFPLLALKGLEESALPIAKGRKKLLKDLKKSRQKREWIIGNYYWALWKWRMKEIHNTKFKFVPFTCIVLLHELLLTPVPPHLLKEEGDEGDNICAPEAKVRLTDGMFE